MLFTSVYFLQKSSSIKKHYENTEFNSKTATKSSWHKNIEVNKGTSMWFLNFPEITVKFA